MLFFSLVVSLIEFLMDSIFESTTPSSLLINSSSSEISVWRFSICKIRLFEVFILLSDSANSRCAKLNLVSIFCLASLYALKSFKNSDFSSRNLVISFFSIDRSSPNFFSSDVLLLKFSSFEDLSSFIILSFDAASRALYRSNSLPSKSYRSFRFLSTSNSSICFLTSPIFAIATSNF